MAAIFAGIAAFSGAQAASAAPPWLAPVDLGAPQPGSSTGAPDIGVARDGTAVVVALRREGAVDVVVASVRPPGGSFSPPVTLSDNSANSSGAGVAVDPQGNATAAWISAGVVRVKYRPVNGDWGTAQLISSSDASEPDITPGANGGAAITYNAGAGPAARVQVAIRPPGSPNFNSPVPVSPPTGSGFLYPPQVGMDPAGDVIAVWERYGDFGGTTHYVFESAIKAANKPTFKPAEQRTSTVTGTVGSGVYDVIMRSNGQAFAVWEFYDGTAGASYQINYAERSASADFEAGVWEARSPPLSSGNAAFAPKIAFDNSGAVFLTYRQDDTVKSRVRPFGGSFSAVKPLSGPGAIADASTLAVAPNGEAVIAWPASSGSDPALFSARRRPGAEEFSENTEIIRGASGAGGATYSGPAVALDDQGNGFIAWRRTISGSPSTYTTQAAGYDIVAPAITGLTAPNAATVGTAVGFAVTASDRMGPPAIAWEFGDGATATGGSVSHAYASAGVFTVKVTATDATGNRSESTRPVQVAAAPPPPGPPSPPAIDADKDGSPAGLDCNDGDAKINPAAREIRGNKVDENCDKRADPFATVGAVAALSWDRLRSGRTRIKSLRVEGLEKGDVVSLTCATRKRGCRKGATRTISAKASTVSFAKYVKGMTLAPKGTLVIRVTRNGAISRIVSYRMVRKKDPSKRVRCQDPGAAPLKAC